MINAVEPDTSSASDRQICEAVRQALATKMPKAAQHITITVERGVVHLWGILGSDEELADVPKIVADLAGVRAVRDHRRDWAWSD
jgi:osmotically-inducible protein OsmY